MSSGSEPSVAAETSSSSTAIGAWQVATTGSQGSGILRSMSQANGMVLLHHEQGDVGPGELVDVLPFDAWL